MSIVQLVAAIQSGGSQQDLGNQPIAEYFVFALMAIVLALMVLIFVRTSERRSSKRRS